MGKHVSLLAYGRNCDNLCRGIQRKLASMEPALFGNADIRVFGNIKELLPALSGAFEDAKVVLLCVTPEQYLNLKELLLRSLGLPIAANPRILRQLELRQTAAPQTRSAHATVPAGAEVFLSGDGLYSGFGARAGGQYFLYLPLDAERLGTIWNGGFRTYISAITQNASPTGGLLPERDTPQAHAEPSEANMVASLFSAGLDVAVAQTKNADYVMGRLQAVPGHKKIFVETPCPVEKGALKQKNYIALLAKTARIAGDCNLGIALSSVFASKSENGAHFVFIGLANEEYVRVLKVYGLPGENPRNLMNESVSQLFQMLDSYAGQQGFSLPRDIEIQQEQPERRKRSALVLSLCATVAVITCLFVAAMVSAWNDTDPPEETGNPSTSQQSGAETAGVVAEDGNPPWYEYMNQPAEEDEQRSQMPTVEPTEEPTREITTQAPTSQEESQSQTTAPTTDRPTTTEKISTTLTTIMPPTTTARPTQPPTGTAVQETTAKASSASGTVAEKGVFTFSCYGFGHGVGMSQEGAITMAKQGKTYKEILSHYYGLKLVTDADTPSTVKYNGTAYNLVEYLARTTEREIGSNAPNEALKAQVVTAYTYAMQRDFGKSDKKLGPTQHAFLNKAASEKVTTAVYQVLGMNSSTDKPKGQYLEYNGKPAFTPYFASAAGKTTSSSSVWGGAQSTYPYLAGGVQSPESHEAVHKQISSEDLRKAVEKYNNSSSCKQKIVLQKNPAEWIQIVKHDQSVNRQIGYIQEMRIGNVTMTGNEFRYLVLGLSIRSHCFTLSFEPE